MISTAPSSSNHLWKEHLSFNQSTSSCPHSHPTAGPYEGQPGSPLPAALELPEKGLSILSIISHLETQQKVSCPEGTIRHQDSHLISPSSVLGLPSFQGHSSSLLPTETSSVLFFQNIGQDLGEMWMEGKKKMCLTSELQTLELQTLELGLKEAQRRFFSRS